MQYRLYEHSTIVELQTDNMFPRFLKYDIRMFLNKVQGVDFAGLVNFQAFVMCS
ncbi:hypothetical protein HYC85_031142 [Camellia sinensis]|uniref:Uncharacterized protein n=1 Tax=Camellia sinensis TaxID=4442 RepID=A0A7J7FQ59_CAMSI|nr:hypothetical protein HYC85_031142 [Camellia sinensis]